jgi:hypothetical protein
MEAAEPTRVLLDVLPGAAGEFDESFLSRTGLSVSVCAGPEQSTRCPLVAGHGCRAFEEAHGIVFELDFDNPEHRAIVESYRELAREDMPIRVVLTPDQAERYRDQLQGVEVWTHEPTVAELDGFAARVEAAQRGSEAGSP